MVAGLGPNSGRVVEFGPGTGVFTRAILNAGVHPKDLVLFEMNPDFAGHLRRQFPDVTVHIAGAQDAPKHCTDTISTVISGLPLLSMPTDIRRAIVGGAFNILRKGGAKKQFTYGPNPPLDEASFTALGLTHQRKSKIWLNIPPATVYAFHRRSEGMPDA